MAADQAETLSQRLFQYRQDGDINDAYQLCSEFLQNDPTASQQLSNPSLLRSCCWTLIDTIKATPEMPLSEKIPEALSLLAKLPLDQLPETKEFRQIYGSILKWGFGDPVALATSEHYGEALDGYRHFLPALFSHSATANAYCSLFEQVDPNGFRHQAPRRTLEKHEAGALLGLPALPKGQ